MAFVAMYFAGIVLILLLIYCGIMASCFITAVILKILNRKKESKKKRIAGNVFMTIGIILAVPLAVFGVKSFINSLNYDVKTPDGQTEKVSSGMADKMSDWLKGESGYSIEELGRYLKKEPALINMTDANYNGVIEIGMKNGNAELVEFALMNGAVFDYQCVYEYKSTGGSMGTYIDYLFEHHREITDDDVKILGLMFENGASTEVGINHSQLYSNLLGKAAWIVLYNDENVSDTEIEFIKVFTDNGITTDEEFLPYEELGSNHHFSSDYHFDVKRDENYYKVTDLFNID